jgi:hypothetical protein
MEMVKVTLARDPETLQVDRDAPFMVCGFANQHPGFYEKEPEVLAQIGPDEQTAYFMAHWDGKEWRFGPRITDLAPA